MVVVNARELHEFLASKQNFSNWIKERIESYEFVENVDYVVFNNFVKNPKGGRSSIEYAITVTMAKELAMVENEVPKTTSLLVAKFFGKRQSEVLRKIDLLDCSKEFSERMTTVIEVVTVRKTGNIKMPKRIFSECLFCFRVIKLWYNRR